MLFCCQLFSFFLFFSLLIQFLYIAHLSNEAPAIIFDRERTQYIKRLIADTSYPSIYNSATNIAS